MVEAIAGAAYLVICWLVGLAAKRMMYRSMLGWTALALFFSPVVAFIFLSVAGPPVGAADQIREAGEAEQQRKIAEDQRRAELECPSCAVPVNLLTRMGITSTEKEPWRMSCANCAHEIEADQL